MEETTFDPSHRRLCPDGTCVGVIGADGRCRECGRAADASASDPAGPHLTAVPARAEGESDDESADGSGNEALSAGAARDHDALDAGGFDSARRLCDDGSCIGVVQESGVCSVCGRSAGQGP
jgi:hypothetical protein